MLKCSCLCSSSFTALLYTMQSINDKIKDHMDLQLVFKQHWNHLSVQFTLLEIFQNVNMVSFYNMFEISALYVQISRMKWHIHILNVLHITQSDKTPRTVTIMNAFKSSVLVEKFHRSQLRFQGIIKMTFFLLQKLFNIH